MQIVLCFLIGYLIGNINPAYILSKLNGFDIRERGSGNAGASNVTMIMGKKAGVFTALFDISKAFIASVIAVSLFSPLRYAKIISGVSCIIGHIFPFMMKFHGGKGLACLGGVILSFNPTIFFALLLVEIIIALMVDYICFERIYNGKEAHISFLWRRNDEINRLKKQ